MGKVFTIWTLASVLLIALSLSSAHAQERSREELVRLAELTPPDLDELKHKSVNGNSSSSLDVALHYLWKDRSDLSEYFFFLRLSAEQGSCEAVYEMHRRQKNGLLPEILHKSGGWNSEMSQCRRTGRIRIH
jgi:hypothetical protein